MNVSIVKRQKKHSLKNITWFVFGKQNVQAKEVNLKQHISIVLLLFFFLSVFVLY